MRPRILLKYAVIVLLLGLGAHIAFWALKPSSPILAGNLSPEKQELARADLLAKLGNWDAAGPIFARLEKRFATTGDTRNEIYARVSRLRAEEDSRDLQQLSNQLSDILTRSEVQRDLALKQRVLEVKSHVDLNLDGVSARIALEELARVAMQRNDIDAASRAQGELGIVAFLEGNASQAKRLLLTAIGKAIVRRDIGAQIRYFAMMGQGMVNTDRAAAALWFLDRAINLAHSNPNAGFPKVAMTGKAGALTELGRFREASQVIDLGLEYGRKNGDLGYVADMLAQKGFLLAQENNIPQAIAFLYQAGTLAQQIHFNRAVAEVDAQLATLYRQTGDLAKAELAARGSVNAHRQIGEVYELPHHLAIEGDIQAALGDLATAQRTFETAERMVGTMLQNTPTPAVKKAVVAAMSQVFLNHFDLEARINNVSGAYDVIEEARGRVAADRLRARTVSSRSPPQIAADERRLAQLQLKLLDAVNPRQRQEISDAVTEAELRLSDRSDDSVRVPGGNRPSLGDLQHILRSQEIVLEYVIGDEASYCLTVRRDNALATRIASRKQIDSMVDRYLEALKQKRPAKEEGAALYSAVLRPIPGIADATDLIVIPDGSLHYIPFGALSSGAGAEYLVETHAVSYSPSGTTLTVLRNRANEGREDLLAVGGVPYEVGSGQIKRQWALLRGLDSLRRGDLTMLPGSVQEVREVGDVLRDAPSLLLSGDQATERNFKREAAKGFEIVHLAVHAFADKDYPDRSALIFAPDRNSGEDGLLQVREIRDLQLNHTRLVALSACDTSVGQIDGEEGVSNIVSAFLYAGARSAVSTYWQVDDSSTADLMKIFYEGLRRGMSEASAMRNAQMSLLRRGEETQVPFYWAAFSVMGDGSTGVRKVNGNDN
jgi:CHAT domain-containing protein